MGIYGDYIKKVILEKDVPVVDGDDYAMEDDDEATPAGKNVDTGEEEEYALPEEEEEEEVPEEDAEEVPEEDAEEVPEGDAEETPEDDADDEAGSGYDLPDDTEEDSTEEPGDAEDPETADTEEPAEGIPDEEGEEADLFVDLSDAQKAIRDKALYKLYADLYTTSSDFLAKIDKIPRNKNTLYELDFVSKQGENFKTLIFDYVVQTYKTKTYIENYSNYYNFLNTFNQFNKLLEEMYSEVKKNEQS